MWNVHSTYLYTDKTGINIKSPVYSVKHRSKRKKYQMADTFLYKRYAFFERFKKEESLLKCRREKLTAAYFFQ